MRSGGAGLSWLLAWVVGGAVRWSNAWFIVGIFFLSMWSSVSWFLESLNPWMCDSSWCFFLTCVMCVTAALPLQCYWIILGRPSWIPGLWIEWKRKTKTMCMGNVSVLLSSVFLVRLDSHHGLLNCSPCYCLHAAGIILTKPIEIFNQSIIKDSDPKFLSSCIFHCPKSPVLYQQLCGMQIWSGQQVGCDMDQWLCMHDHVAFIHVAFIRPQPYITHRSTPVPFRSKATCHLEQMHGSWNQSWRLTQHILFTCLCFVV